MNTVYARLTDILDKWLTLPFEGGQNKDTQNWELTIEFAEQGKLTFIFYRDMQTLIDVKWESAW